MNKIYNSFSENILEPTYDIVRGTSRSKYGKKLMNTQWLTRNEIKHIQEQNLFALLKHAYDTVPYYHRIFKERNLQPSDIKKVEDLSKLPILTKQDINNNFNDLISTSYKRKDLIPYQSGGSGDPIRFLITRDKISWELAAEYRAYRWAGYRRGDRCLLLWGSSIDLAEDKALLKRLTRKFERTVVLDAWLLSDEVMSSYVEKFRMFKPDAVRGYANAVYMLAKYCNKHGIVDLRPRTVVTSAEKLLDSKRRDIETAFGTRVFDYYGSREIGAIAAECDEHNGYHINAENLALEIIREDEPASVDEEGAIIITSLRNYGMPFIRYQIGDVGKLSDEICICGRGLPLLSSVEGRLSDFLAIYDKKKGRIMPYMVGSPGFVGSIFMYVPVSSYRVIQERIDLIRIQMVKGEGYSQKDNVFVISAVKRFLGDNCEVEFEFLESIPPLPSGKRSTFSSKIDSWIKKQ